ncbi:uncharacterized protein METZ01_LOCUS456142, partial [marine metagenome]
VLVGVVFEPALVHVSLGSVSDPEV